MNFSSENFIGLISVSLQLSGAVLLMIKFWGNLWNDILRKYFNSSEGICRDDGDFVFLRKEKLREISMKIYLTRFSFIYIVIGYLLSVFHYTVSKSLAALVIAILSLLLCIFAAVVSFIVCRIKYRIDKKISYDEAVEKGGAMQFIGAKDVEEIWNEVNEK